MPCVARLCAQAPGAVRLRRDQANLRQLHRALLQGEHARADQTGDALGRPTHAVAPPGAGGPAHSRRPSAGANPSPVAIASVGPLSADMRGGTPPAIAQIIEDVLKTAP